MAFIEVIPKRVQQNSYSSSKIRIKFYSRNGKINKDIYYRLYIFLGRDIAKKIGIKPRDKISLSYDDKNPRTWLLKKSNGVNGYTLGGKPDACYFKINLAWSLFKPEESEEDMHYVKNDIYNGGIRIFADVPLSEQEDPSEEEVESDDH